MKKILFTVLLLALVAACALPQGRWVIDTRLQPTAWEGGPPMATEEAQATEQAVATEVEATAVVIATEEAPQEESTPEPAACDIAGNINGKGEKIYHLPTGAYYNLVRIEPESGEGWYCTEDEAQAAGFRKSLR